MRSTRELRTSGRAAPWLAAVTGAYLLWCLLPLLLVVLFSFNVGDSVTRWEGFGLRWWTGDPGAAESILYDPEIRARLAHSLLLALGTTLLAVPIGTTFALGCRGWRSRLTGAGMTVVLLAVALPVIALAAAMWLFLAYPLRSFPFGEFGWFGTRAQLAGLTTMFLPIVALIIWTRLWYLDRQQEELATDLGAPPGDVVRRIILPQLRLAILAAAAVVFAGALSEFVLTDQLVGQNDTRAIGPLLLVRSTNAAPRVNAVGTALALVAAVAFSLMVLAFGPFASADARRNFRRPAPGRALRRPDPVRGGIGSE